MGSRAVLTESMPPGPGTGSLTLAIECTSTPDARFGVRHAVTINPDWTVTTPHDLESDRVAAAFGAWSSCVVFAERVVPAYRHMHDILTGIVAPRRDERGRWRSRGAEGCHGPHTHTSLHAAIRHDVSVEHVARRYHVPAWRIEEIAAEARRAWTTAADPALIDGGAAGYSHLWARGIHPARAARIAKPLPPHGRPYRPSVVESIEAGVLDPQWLSAVAEVYSTKAFVAWAAQQTERSRAGDIDGIRALRDIGIAPGDAILALDRGVTAESITAVASRTGVAAARITRWLVLWSRIGCTPNADHYRLLDAMGLLTTIARDSDVTYVLREAERQGRAVDRTEIGVMLAIEPSPARVLAAIRSGAIPSSPLRAAS